jgi:hypothetical protein
MNPTMEKISIASEQTSGLTVPSRDVSTPGDSPLTHQRDSSDSLTQREGDSCSQPAPPKLRTSKALPSKHITRGGRPRPKSGEAITDVVKELAKLNAKTLELRKLMTKATKLVKRVHKGEKNLHSNAIKIGNLLKAGTLTWPGGMSQTEVRKSQRRISRLKTLGLIGTLKNYV